MAVNTAGVVDGRGPENVAVSFGYFAGVIAAVGVFAIVFGIFQRDYHVVTRCYNGQHLLGGVGVFPQIGVVVEAIFGNITV